MKNKFSRRIFVPKSSQIPHKDKSLQSKDMEIIMKRTVIGVALLVCATLTDIGIMLSASILAYKATGAEKFWTALTENGFLLPFVLAKILFILAVAVLLREYFSKSTK